MVEVCFHSQVDRHHALVLSLNSSSSGESMNTALHIPGTAIPYTIQEQLVVDARASRIEMFQAVPWQLFTTHDFTRSISHNRVDAEWTDYLEAVRAVHRDTIGLLWSKEQVFAQNAAHRVAPHFHCLWVSNKSLDPGLLRSEWIKRAGTSGRPIDIRSCDGGPQVISYLLKLSENPNCDWQLTASVEFFMGVTVELSNSQARRRCARFMERQARQ
jgi:hypothetical protein